MSGGMPRVSGSWPVLRAALNARLEEISFRTGIAAATAGLAILAAVAGAVLLILPGTTGPVSGLASAANARVSRPPAPAAFVPSPSPRPAGHRTATATATAKPSAVPGARPSAAQPAGSAAASSSVRSASRAVGGTSTAFGRTFRTFRFGRSGGFRPRGPGRFGGGFGFGGFGGFGRPRR